MEADLDGPHQGAGLDCWELHELRLLLEVPEKEFAEETGDAAEEELGVGGGLLVGAAQEGDVAHAKEGLRRR